MDPGLAIFSFWQGTAEIVIRATSIVLAVISMTMAAVAVDTVNGISDEYQDIINTDDTTSGFPYTPDLVTNSRGVCGWILFLSLATLFYQPLVILLRLLNVELINLKSSIFLAIDIFLSGLFALGYLAGGIAAASLASSWKQWHEFIADLKDEQDDEGLRDSVNDLVKDNGLEFETIYATMSTSAGAVFPAVFVFGALLIWMCFFATSWWSTKLVKKNTT